MLFIASLIMGYLGLNIESLFGAEVFIYLFGIVGVLSPGLYVLEKIYIEVKKSK